MSVRPLAAPRVPQPVRAVNAARAAAPAPAPKAPARPVTTAVKPASSSHAIAKWSLIGGTALGAFGVPMMAMLGGAGLGLWMLPAALAGAAFGAVCYGGIGFLVDRVVGHFRH